MKHALAIIVLAACGKGSAPAPTEQGSAPASPLAAVPDITTLDWPNFSYDMASLGTVTAKGGVAQFWLEDDEDGQVRAVQTESDKGEWTGKLVVGAPSYADVDGDKHDEALLPFELSSSVPDEVPHVYGMFVYTLRSGSPVKLDTVTAPTLVKADGAKIATVDGAHRWAWDAKRAELIEAPR